MELEVGTEVWPKPGTIAEDESGGRPGVVVHVQPEEAPDAWDDDFDGYGWNGDDVFVKWRNGREFSYQYEHLLTEDQIEHEKEKINGK